METQNTRTVVEVTPSIEMPPRAIKGCNKWFNENLDIVTGITFYIFDERGKFAFPDGDEDGIEC